MVDQQPPQTTLEETSPAPWSAKSYARSNWLLNNFRKNSRKG